MSLLVPLKSIGRSRLTFRRTATKAGRPVLLYYKCLTVLRRYPFWVLAYLKLTPLRLDLVKDVAVRAVLVLFPCCFWMQRELLSLQCA